MATEANKAAFRAALMAATDKYVKQQARNTIALNAENDPACEGYARIPGPDACEFCVTMGAASDFYHTRESAGGGAGHGSKDDAYHAHCNCQVCIVFRRRGRLVANDPETGGPVPYDGAEMIRRYNEAGRPTFSHNRAAEAERRRMRRRNGEVPTGRGAGGTRAGARLPGAEFDAAMTRLSGAKTVDELRSVADEIVESWGGRNAIKDQAQWAEMSRHAKAKMSDLKGNRVSGGLDGMEAWLSKYEPEMIRIEIDGVEILRDSGTAGEALFPEKLPNSQSYRSAHLFHTHTNPVSGTFSDDDINTTMRTCAKKHTLDHTLTGDQFVLTRTERATKSSRKAFAKEYGDFLTTRIEDECYEAWIKFGYKDLQQRLPDAERRKVIKSLQPEFDRWLHENAYRFGYVYESKGVHLV